MASSLHFVMVPLMAPGHIIPMIEMAKLLSDRGVAVSVVVTHLDAARFSSAVAGHPIRLLKVHFPCADAGLPAGCESADLLPSYTLLPNFFAAVEMLQNPIGETLRRLSPPPACLISDKHIIWTVETCSDLQIPRIVFDGMSCFTQVVTHHLHTSQIYKNFKPYECFPIPNLPHKIELSQSQLPGLFNPGPGEVKGFRERVRETEALSLGMIVNTFHELEANYVEEYLKLERGRIWCIGPLSTSTATSRHECLEWLDSKKVESVVYACLGSLSRLSGPQFAELALGLEASGREFLVVVKGDDEIEGWMCGDGIEGRVGGRGFFLRGWAPQVEILGHSAVGGFLTHCGWNSTLEGITAGVAMVTWPLFAEQFLNEKVVVEVHGVGVGVGARGVVHLGVEGDMVMVRREAIRAAVERVMDGGEEGCERRKRARELGEMARRSVREGGSSYRNITKLIQDIADLTTKCNSVVGERRFPSDQ